MYSYDDFYCRHFKFEAFMIYLYVFILEFFI